MEDLVSYEGNSVVRATQQSYITSLGKALMHPTTHLRYPKLQGIEIVEVMSQCVFSFAYKAIHNNNYIILLQTVPSIANEIFLRLLPQDSFVNEFLQYFVLQWDDHGIERVDYKSCMLEFDLLASVRQEQRFVVLQSEKAIEDAETANDMKSQQVQIEELQELLQHQAEVMRRLQTSSAAAISDVERITWLNQTLKNENERVNLLLGKAKSDIELIQVKLDQTVLQNSQYSEIMQSVMETNCVNATVNDRTDAPVTVHSRPKKPVRQCSQSTQTLHNSGDGDDPAQANYLEHDYCDDDLQYDHKQKLQLQKFALSQDMSEYQIQGP